MGYQLSPRERRWLDAVLVLAAFALGFVVLEDVVLVVGMFSDLILVFFLAWLFAFVLSPLVSALARILPVGRTAATVVVYMALLGVLVVAVVAVAETLAGSVADFLAYVPHLRDDLPRILAPWQAQITALGFHVDLVAGARQVLERLDTSATQLVGPLQDLAVASAGAIGNLLLVVIFSLYLVADRERIVDFLYWLIPAGYEPDARVLEAAIGRSFGGFIRGQALTGLAYAAVAGATSAALGLDFAAATTAAAGMLMAIPFFGPFVAWAPPVLVAVFAKPDALLPTVIAMAVGWLIVMNAVQPRIMANALRIHPIVVLAAVIVGLKVAGIAGAIFGIPVAAVLSAVFFHLMARTRGEGPRRAAAEAITGEDAAAEP